MAGVMAGRHAAARQAALVTAVSALAMVVRALGREFLAAGAARVQLIAPALACTGGAGGPSRGVSVLSAGLQHFPPSRRGRDFALACCWCCRAEAGKRFRQQVK
jgi:hypothetical protein